jgi:ribosomal protein L32
LPHPVQSKSPRDWRIPQIVEVCPQCGDFVLELLRDTGWCRDCSPKRCERCGKEIKLDQKSRRLCSWCRRNEWFERNFDLIEEFLVIGFSLSEAILRTKDLKFPRCLNCGNVINRGHFCSEEECRKAYHRYKWNRWERKMSEEQALREAIK